MLFLIQYVGMIVCHKQSCWHHILKCEDLLLFICNFTDTNVLIMLLKLSIICFCYKAITATSVIDVRGCLAEIYKAFEENIVYRWAHMLLQNLDSSFGIDGAFPDVQGDNSI